MAQYIIKNILKDQEKAPRNSKFKTGTYHIVELLYECINSASVMSFIYTRRNYTSYNLQNQDVDYDGYFLFDDATGVFIPCNGDGDPNLPKGSITCEDQLTLDDWFNGEKNNTISTPKCTCGIEKTYGIVDTTLHSNWCDLKGI